MKRREFRARGYYVMRRKRGQNHPPGDLSFFWEGKGKEGKGGEGKGKEGKARQGKARQASKKRGAVWNPFSHSPGMN
jgi:hypothetical protein